MNLFASSIFIALVLGWALIGSGCVVAPVSYRQVDTTSPEFREAVAQEVQRLQANQAKAAGAEREALRVVTARWAAEEKQRRESRVTDLVRLLEDMEQPRGGWAYTVTQQRRQDGVLTSRVFTFNPFYEDEARWTLLQRDDRPATAEEQADFRRRAQARWVKAQARTEGQRESQRVSLDAVRHDFRAERGEGRDAYTFVQGRVKVPLLADVAGIERTYIAAREQAVLLERRERSLGPMTSLLGVMRVDAFESRTEFAKVEPGVAPFVARVTLRLQGKLFGREASEVEIVETYTDYRRVKTYADRFETYIGPLNVLDLGAANMELD